jgi:hypothetical protein
MSASPTFVCTFEDQVTVRMTTWHGTKTLDLVRGIRLARAAYKSRTKRLPVTMVEAKFESTDGTVLQTYDSKQLEEASQ